MRLEFEAELAEYAGEDNMRVFTEDEYKKIEYVYTWHPAIKAVGGKRQIAVIWQEFGMGMINDMHAAAQEMEVLDTRRKLCRKDLDEVNEEIQSIKNCYT